MKLHLPVRLFRAVVAVMAAASASLTVPQAYAVSNITYEGYKIESDYSAQGSAYQAYSDTELSADRAISFLSNSVQISYTTSEFDSIWLDSAGAVYVSNSTLLLDTPGDVLFAENSLNMDVALTPYWGQVDAHGGAVKLYDGKLEITNAANVGFAGNEVNASITLDGDSTEEFWITFNITGGAIAGDMNITGVDQVEFSGNKVEVAVTGYYDEEGYYHTPSGYLRGGAIAGNSVIFAGTGGALTVSDNLVSSVHTVEYNSSGEVYGGAIDVSESLIVKGYDSVVVSGNIASNNFTSAYGGAIYGRDNSLVRFTDNEEIVFENNFAGDYAGGQHGYGTGGAIYGDLVYIHDNGSVLFSGNCANNSGAAIYADYLSIQNNDSVVFAGNFQNAEYGYCSSSISANTLVLSAAKDKSIEIRESISVANLEIGNSYTDESGVTISQTGTVLFTGADAEYNYKQSQDRSDADVNRTFAVTNATINGGSLVLADKAILTAKTLTTTAGSGAIFALQGSVLNNSAGTYTINSGTTLSLSGQNKATVSSLQMNTASLLSFTLSDVHARRSALTISGDFEVRAGAAFIFNFAEDATVYSKNALITLVDSTPEELSWSLSDILLIGPGGTALSTSSLYWEDNTLYVSFNDLPTYQTSVIYVDETTDITSVSGKMGDYVFRLQSDISVTAEEAPIFNMGASWEIISDREESKSTLALSTSGARIIDMDEQESLIVEGLERFALDGSYLYEDAVKMDAGTLAYVENGEIILKHNDEVSVSGNAVYSQTVSHDANSLIYSQDSKFSAEQNNLVKIKNNYIDLGSVIYGNVNLSNNTKVEIAGNHLSGIDSWVDGAVVKGKLHCENNDEVIISSNGKYNNWQYPTETSTSVYMLGSAVYGASSFIGNDKITFSSNYIINLLETDGYMASQNGGACLYYRDYDFIGNGDILFSDNSVDVGVYATEGYFLSYGGAIGHDASFLDNSSVVFKSNCASGELYIDSDENQNRNYGTSGGGAMNVSFAVSRFAGNSLICFDGNSARININNGRLSEIVSTATGGAIHIYSQLVIDNNGDVSFSKNSARASGDLAVAYGGAIYLSYINRTYSNAELRIQNNDSVLFCKNYEKTDAGYRLRSIVIEESEPAKFILSAGKDSDITIQDSIGIVTLYPDYVNVYPGYYPISGTTDVQFNNMYINDDGEKIAQTGDIIFTGAYTEEHLKEIKYGTAGTAAEILNSRTSEVWALTKLYDGRLRIEDGAIYKGFGLTAFSSVSGQSNPTVLLKNGEMNHDGYSITLNAGARLELSGTNTISADNLQLNNGAGFVFNVDDTHLTTAALSYTGALTLGGELVICINAEDGLTIGNTYKLMTVTDASATEAMSWDGTHITIQAGNGLGVVSNDLIWEDNVLYLNYTGTPTINELKLTWLGGKNAVWQTGCDTLWVNTLGDHVVYRDGDLVTFTQDTIEIVGEVKPASITLTPEKSVTFKTKYDKKTGEWSGSIGGEGISVTIAGADKSKVTMNDGNIYTGITSIESGTVNVGGATSFGKSSIAISGGTLDLKSKEVANDIELTGSATIKGGKKYVGTYTQTGGELMKGSVLNVAEEATISGGVVNGTLSGVGTVTIDGDVELGESGKITTDKLLVDGSLAVSAKGLAMNTKTSAIEINGGKISSKGKVSAASLNLNGGSLSLSGALSVKDLTLGSGTLTLDSAKLTTVKVGNTLELEGGTTLNLGFNVKAKDEGKSFKIFTFKTISTSITDITDAVLNDLLGLGTDAATLAFDSKRKAITLTVTNAEAWNEYAESVRNGTWTPEPGEDDVLVESAGAFVLARPAAAAIDPMLGKVADTLVQSTWGTAGASRAFVDTIAARGTHATALADGKGAAWISTMGGSSRLSSDGGHAGADYTLTGAAFGMEARLSEKSTVGLAIGNSWGKVSTFSAFPVDQDSTHQGIYGKHLLGSSTTLSWMAAHTRTENDANLAGMACDWTQDALQLDARVDKLFAISNRTTVSAFVGMQYLATDKGECNGLSTGSLQNLRGEIGVSTAHKATDRTYVYGELSFVGDMVRNNPTATIGDYRSRGANPGRAGLNLSVGASYQLNDSWSLNGSYSLELMQNQTSHSANVGATYSF